MPSSRPASCRPLMLADATDGAELDDSRRMALLARMAGVVAVLAVLTVMRLAWPLPRPVDLPVNEKMNLETKADVKVWGAVVVVMTVALYVVFW